MRSSIPALMTEASRGVLDTSVLIDHDLIATERLPDESAITAVALAELAAGPHVAENKQGALRGLAHCLDRRGQWIATLHTQSL
jgi:predicted nucleic acid-binding protein